MAKEKRNQPSEKFQKKQVNPSQGAGSGSLFSNGAIILVLSIVFFVIYKLNDHAAELQDLRNEMEAIRQGSGDEQRANEIKRRLHEINVDTGFVKTLFLGYYADLHNVAFGVNDQIEQAKAEVKEQKGKIPS